MRNGLHWKFFYTLFSSSKKGTEGYSFHDIPEKQGQTVHMSKEMKRERKGVR